MCSGGGFEICPSGSLACRSGIAALPNRFRSATPPAPLPNVFGSAGRISQLRQFYDSWQAFCGLPDPA